MASWIVHLRLAERLYTHFQNLDYTAFCLGNIAIDSGKVNEDLTVTPPVTISHWTKSGKKSDCDYEGLFDTYFNKDQDNFTQSFYLGCVSHLMTDNFWVLDLFNADKIKYAKELAADKFFVLEIKKDWYDQDFLYLQKQPDFKPLQVLAQIHDFKNTYLPWFDEDAIQIKLDELVSFYQDVPTHLDREYPFLDEKGMNTFVENTAKKIEVELKRLLAK